MLVWIVFSPLTIGKPSLWAACFASSENKGTLRPSIAFPKRTQRVQFDHDIGGAYREGLPIKLAKMVFRREFLADTIQHLGGCGPCMKGLPCRLRKIGPVAMLLTDNRTRSSPVCQAHS